MQFCQKHWDMLRAAINDRGLSHLVAKSSEEAMESIVAQLQGGEGDYDPLMDCYWMITNRALEVGGLYLLSGDLCPVCEAMKHTAHIPALGSTTNEPAGAEWVEKHWIDGPADAVLKHCQQQGLTTPAQ